MVNAWAKVEQQALPVAAAAAAANSTMMEDIRIHRHTDTESKTHTSPGQFATEEHLKSAGG